MKTFRLVTLFVFAIGATNSSLMAQNKNQGSFQLDSIQGQWASTDIYGNTKNTTSTFPASKLDFHIRYGHNPDDPAGYVAVDMTFGQVPTMVTEGSAHTVAVTITVQSSKQQGGGLISWEGSFGNADHTIAKDGTAEYHTMGTLGVDTSDRPGRDWGLWFHISLDEYSPDLTYTTSQKWDLNFDYKPLGTPRPPTSIPAMGSNDLGGSTMYLGGSGQLSTDNLSSPGIASNGGNPITLSPQQGTLGVSITLQNSVVMVVAVRPGSPADLAGIRKGDGIVALNGTKVTTPAEFKAKIAGMQSGTQITLMILRNVSVPPTQGTIAPPVSANSVVPPRGPEAAAPQATEINLSGTWLFRGIRGQNCTIRQNGSQLELTTEKGVRGAGGFENATTIVANFPFAAGLKGTIMDNGNRIQWSNGEPWVRAAPSSESGAHPSPAPGVFARFAGAWVAPYDGGEATVTLDSLGSGESEAHGTGGQKENGKLFDCHMDGDELKCKWNSTYSDGDKTIARGGDLTLTVTEGVLTLSSTVDPQSLQEKWNTGRYPSAAERGGVMQYKRRNARNHD